MMDAAWELVTQNVPKELLSSLHSMASSRADTSMMDAISKANTSTSDTASKTDTSMVDGATQTEEVSKSDISMASPTSSTASAGSPFVTSVRPQHTHQTEDLTAAKANTSMSDAASRADSLTP